jgi:hypothetical protein
VPQLECPKCHTYRVTEEKTHPNANLLNVLGIGGFFTFGILWIPAVLLIMIGATEGKHVGWACSVCGYRWETGDPAPAQSADPTAVAAVLAERAKAVYCRSCGQPVPGNVRSCPLCGLARW